MKKLFIVLAGLTMFSFMACGPSQEEQDKQKKVEDSLFEKDRNNALDNANKLLSADSMPGNDSVAKVDTKSKK
jgi:hypothetical protein